MIASLYKIITDNEGESKITFSIPSSGLADVVMLNALLLKKLNLEITESHEQPKIGFEEKELSHV